MNSLPRDGGRNKKPVCESITDWDLNLWQKTALNDTDFLRRESDGVFTIMLSEGLLGKSEIFVVPVHIFGLGVPAEEL